ncbi:hypothetical protein O181_076603 [Austropuccinia psidii MF-1]|uniref:Uncharacterized protein n=1 Tax=Austropuccinia psidii MF-1 TaxID=1389203 RepID=A0A9Q3ICY0_9BASI|nr:hypothetical protein [Austropuccinia psidii MF-1]
MLGRVWNPKLPVDNLKKDLVYIHTTKSSYKLLLDKLRHHANKIITDAFEHSEKRWDKIHKTPKFEVGYLILVSTMNINSTKGPKKLKDLFAGTFIIQALHWKNESKVEFSGELENKQ